jgi:hypothetical protein
MKPSGNGVCAFGQTYANEVRRRRPRCGDKWHLDARLPHNQGQEALPLAGRGPGRQCELFSSLVSPPVLSHRSSFNINEFISSNNSSLQS